MIRLLDQAERRLCQERDKAMDSAGKDQGDALGDQRLARLLGHVLRARLAAELKTGYREPAELAETLGESISWVEYHCRVLALPGCRPVHAGDDGGQHRAHISADSVRDGATKSR
jgi:hypothetical protein